MSFYLTLPSNSSLEYFPDNTLTHFITKLPRTIDLDGGWEVGLAEIQYPHTWYNVRENDGWMVILDRTNTSDFRKFKVSEGYYPTPQALVKAINDAIKEADPEKRVRLEYNRITEKVSVRLEENISFFLKGSMQRLLGLDGEHHQEYAEAGQVIDMNQGFYSLYVYCNLIEPRVVGDSHVPLLRIVPVQGKHTDLVTRFFQKVYYLPLQQKCFETVEIYIRDDTGQKVPFERGKVVVTLHFRKRRYFL